MKKIYSIILFVVIGFAGKAQGYIPFPDSGAVWVNGYYQSVTTQQWPWPHWEFFWAINHCANGQDTTINSTVYTKIEICEQGLYDGAIRDSSGHVYYIPSGDTTEVLLYNFNLEIGDTLYAGTIDLWYDYVVNQIDSIQIFGEFRKRIYVESGQWVEGIGNITNGLFGDNFDNVSGYDWELECMSVNDSILWPLEGIGTCQLDLGIALVDFDFELFPNPSSDGIVNIQTSSAYDDLTYKIYLPNGQVVQKGILKSDQIDLGPESGMYFMQLSNGKGTLTRIIIVQ